MDLSGIHCSNLPMYNRIKKVLDHYEEQTEEEAMAEDQAAFRDQNQTVMKIPSKLVSAVRELIAKHRE